MLLTPFSAEAHLADYSRVASLLQGAKNRYYLLDPNGSSVGLIRRLLREKVPPIKHILTEFHYHTTSFEVPP